MQFAVPQFTDVEDKLIGSLTLKQFLVLLGAGGIILFFWSVLGPSLPFFILAVPIGIVGIAVALGRYNGRPMFIYLIPFVQYLVSTKVMIFQREPVMPTVHKAPVKKTVKQTQNSELEPADSRLKKLAYLLDKKTQEEKEIISNDFREDIVIPAKHTPVIKKAELQRQVKENLKDIMSLSKSPAVMQEIPAEPEPRNNQAKKVFDPNSIFKK